MDCPACKSEGGKLRMAGKVLYLDECPMCGGSGLLDGRSGKPFYERRMSAAAQAKRDELFAARGRKLELIKENVNERI